MADRIIQIIPAPPDMWARWSPGECCENNSFSRIVCLALKEHEDGTDVVPMVIIEDDGEIMDVFDFSNFGGIVFAKDPHKEATNE